MEIINSTLTQTFEKSVLQALESNIKNLSPLSKLGLAVSGGADSISLLISMACISKKIGFKLYVISVNHNIREESETAGDLEFVKQLCSELSSSGYDLQMDAAELRRGAVNELMVERRCGVEEAARILRYQIFDNYINKCGLDYLLLAHNKNDQIETLLMRFLQGSSVQGSFGILENRNKYLRPLLWATRKEIEEYLAEKRVHFRTDSTNFDDKYFRNKIRLKLIPFLNEQFGEGWQKAILSGAEKAKLDSDFIEEQLLTTKISCDLHKNQASIQKNEFLKLPPALQIRVIYKMCNLIADINNTRIPYYFILDFLAALKTSQTKNFSKKYDNLVIHAEKNELFIKKYQKKQTELSFFAIIDKDGIYEFPFGTLKVYSKNSISFLCFKQFCYKLNVNLPVAIKNAYSQDYIIMADGKQKKVVDLFSNWKVSENDRPLIPLIQNLNTPKQELIGVLGNIYGYGCYIYNHLLEEIKK